MACASCPVCFSPVRVLTVPQPCCTAHSGVLAAPVPTLRPVQVLPVGHCSALGISSCSQLLAFLQLCIVIQPPFPAGFAQTFLLSLCLF